MLEHQMGEEIDILLFLKYYYKKRRVIFRVLILAILLSLAFTVATYLLRPPIYNYTSQSVIDITVGEDAAYQRSMFISHLGSERVFFESAKSLELVADYVAWRDSIVIESIKDTTQIVLKISATNTDKLVELNRRIVSNAIFQSSNILTGISVQTLEEAELLADVQEIRGNAGYISNLFSFVTLGLLSILGWLTLDLIMNRRIIRSKDVESLTGLEVLGTIPDFKKLVESEEVNFRNFARGLIWKKIK